MPPPRHSARWRTATGLLSQIGRRAATSDSMLDLHRPVGRSDLASFARLQHGAVTALLRQEAADAARSQDPAAEADALTVLWEHLDRPGMEHGRREVAEQCLVAAERAPGSRFEIESWDRLFGACLAEGDVHAARQAHATGLRRAEEAGFTELRHLGHRRAATMLTAHGQFDLAQAEALQALHLGTLTGDALAEEVGAAQLAWLDQCRGQPAVLEERSRVRPDEETFDAVPEDGRWTDAMAWATFRVIDLARPDLATALYDVLARHPNGNATHGSIASYGSTASLLAELASAIEQWDLAEAHFEDALRLDHRMAHAPAIVRSRGAFGAMLLRRGASGDRVKGRAMLQHALERADEIGMSGVAADCEQLLASSRRQPRSAEREGA